jgi:hypothetical protein
VNRPASVVVSTEKPFSAPQLQQGQVPFFYGGMMKAGRFAEDQQLFPGGFFTAIGRQQQQQTRQGNSG